MPGTAADSRPLTAGERAIATELFGQALAGDRVRLHHRRWWPLQPPNVVMAPDGDIWIPPEGGLWREDYATAPIHLQALFAHELTHCWQAQRGGRWFLPLVRHPFCRYHYRLRAGWPLARYGLEQQAEIVAHAFLLGRGHAAGKGDAATYRALLPASGS